MKNSVITNPALNLYHVCVTGSGTIAVYPVEGWINKRGVLIPVYDGGRTYQDEHPMTEVRLFEGEAPANPKNTITFEELVAKAEEICPSCKHTVTAEGSSNALVCTLPDGHDGDHDMVGF